MQAASFDYTIRNEEGTTVGTATYVNEALDAGAAEHARTGEVVSVHEPDGTEVAWYGDRETASVTEEAVGTDTPASRSISPSARAFDRTASIADEGAVRYRRSKASAAGNAGHCGSRIRATRPPSWSIRTGTSDRPASPRKSSVSATSCCRSMQLRLNNMYPAGSASRKKARSSAVRTGPSGP